MKLSNINIVNINDIEDIITAKIEIDKNDPDIKERSNLSDFIAKYCTLSDIVISNNNYKPFKYIECFNNKYLFISDENSVDDILNILKSINYNFDKLKEANNLIELMNTPNIQLLMHNNKYYKI